MHIQPTPPAKPPQVRPTRPSTLLNGWTHLLYGGAMLLALVVLFALALAVSRWQRDLDNRSIVASPTVTTGLTTAAEPSLASDPSALISAAALARSGRLVVGIDDPVQAINPLYAVGDGEQDAVSLIFESLVTLDSRRQPVAELAESWSYDAMNKVLTFRLRDDHVFRDGRPVDAGDVVFTYVCLLADSYDGPLQGRFTVIRRVQAVGETGVAFQLADWVLQPDFSWFAIGILKADYYAVPLDRVFEMGEAGLPAEGSGAFELTAMSARSIRLDLRGGYAGMITTIDLRTVEADEKFTLLADGELDIARNRWDTRMQERARRLPAFSCVPYQAVDACLLVNRQPGKQQLLQTASQQLAVLRAAAGWQLTGDDRAALHALQGQTLTLLFFQGIDAAVALQNQVLAENLLEPLQACGIEVAVSGRDWPTLAAHTLEHDYDLMLWPAPVNNRLPAGTYLLDRSDPADQTTDPAQTGTAVRPPAAADAWPAYYRTEVLVVSRRLEQVTVNPIALPLAATTASWTDRIENIRLLTAATP